MTNKLKGTRRNTPLSAGAAARTLSSELRFAYHRQFKTSRGSACHQIKALRANCVQIERRLKKARRFAHECSGNYSQAMVKVRKLEGLLARQVTRLNLLMDRQAGTYKDG